MKKTAEQRYIDYKIKLADDVNKIISKKRLSQAHAAEILGIKQPRVSNLVNFDKNMDLFSIDTLIMFKFILTK